MFIVFEEKPNSEDEADGLDNDRVELEHLLGAVTGRPTLAALDLLQLSVQVKQ